MSNLSMRLKRLETTRKAVGEVWMLDTHANEQEGRPERAYVLQRRHGSDTAEAVLPNDAAWEQYSAVHPEAFAIELVFP